MAVKEFAFDRAPPLSKSSIRGILSLGDDVRRTHGHKFKWMPSKDARIEVGWIAGRLRPSDVECYIYLDGKCEGSIVFDALGIPKKVKDALPGRQLLTPHSTLSEALQGKSYASLIYLSALRKGIALAADHHTDAAAKLWDKLARMDKVHLIYVHERTGKIAESDEDLYLNGWKVLYR